MMTKKPWTRILLTALLVSFPFACGGSGSDGGNDDGDDKTASGGSKDDGSGGKSNEPDDCVEPFADECNRACSTHSPCPDGMHCSSKGVCKAYCAEGFECPEGEKCSFEGRCERDSDFVPTKPCEPLSCEELGHECGQVIDNCGEPRDCEKEEDLSCGKSRRCQAVPVEDDDGEKILLNKCVEGVADCEVCDAIPVCEDEDSPTTLTGRVITPGRDDDDTANQVGVPNAIVYILRDENTDDLPDIVSGLPGDGSPACDRCDEQDLGAVLSGAVTDSSGYFELSSNLPVGRDVILVVKAGKFRRAQKIKIEKECDDNALPEEAAENPARLPRHSKDGLAVNIPRVAVATGSIDAMECVFLKMGIEEDEFTDPSGDGKIHLYRANGAWPPGGPADNCLECAACTRGTCRSQYCTENGTDTCDQACQQAFLAACQEDFDITRLVGDPERISSYDLTVLDCEGSGWSINAGGTSEHLRRYVNRGGRLFASHLSFKWLRSAKDPDANLEYDPEEPLETSLDPAATWNTSSSTNVNINAGKGWISLDRPNASPRIENFAEWMEAEGVTSEEEDYSFEIIQPRSQALELGPATEEFVHCDDTGGVTQNRCANLRTQQFSFNTPYAAPEEEACGRVAYSGFHVAATSGTLDLGDAVFPSYCTNADANNGVLTNQEKVLLYMLFDLGACVGSPPPPPPCVPLTCKPSDCGFHSDGCGGLLDCGECSIPK